MYVSVLMHVTGVDADDLNTTVRLNPGFMILTVLHFNFFFNSVQIAGGEISDYSASVYKTKSFLFYKFI